MIKKEIGIGLFTGIVFNLVGIFLYITFFSSEAFEASLQNAIEEDVMGNIIALGALLNFIPFFVFLNKNKPYRSRGVLIATLLAAMAIIYFKFIA